MMQKLTAQDYALSFQHLLAMFGSTVLVPLITGISPAVALFTAGVGTLVFHLCTKGIVPVFQGSSFAFIGAYLAILGAGEAFNASNIPLMQGGVIAAGAVYLVLALLVKLVGVKVIHRLFPSVVTGPIIIIIGLSLTGVAVTDAIGLAPGAPFTMTNLVNLAIAVFTFAIIATGMNWRSGIFKVLPLLIGILAGYILCLILSLPIFGGFKMDFSPIANASWLNIPYKNGFFSIPKFDMRAILTIAPIALVTFMEHIGDITTNGAVVGKDFFKDPGLHRTLMGDGLATMLAGFFGGPANTTYSENTGVLATTRNYNPVLLRVAACFAIILGLIGKFGAFLQTIPGPVKGGVEIVLFGMIAAIGVRTIVESALNMTSNRNLCIMAATLCCGLGLVINGGINLQFGELTFNVSALFVSTVVGVLLNLCLPQDAGAAKNDKDAAPAKN